MPDVSAFRRRNSRGTGPMVGSLAAGGRLRRARWRFRPVRPEPQRRPASAAYKAEMFEGVGPGKAGGKLVTEGPARS